MARLLLISETTYNPEVNQIGDIIGIFPDNHVFSPNEHVIFDIADCPNITNDEMSSVLKYPEIQEVEDSTSKKIRMWRNTKDEPWKKLEKEMKYQWTTKGLTQEQIDLFKSPEIAKETKLAMLQQLGNNTSYQPENRKIKLNIAITEEVVV